MGDRIRKFGLEKFGSIKEFAEAMGMSPSNLQAYLQDRREPGTPILKRLIDLGCDVYWLLTGEENNDKRLKIIEEQSQRIKELEKENRILRESINKINHIADEAETTNSRKAKNK